MSNSKKKWLLVFYGLLISHLAGCATLGQFLSKDISKKDQFVLTESGLKISIRHDAVTKEKAIIVAPGFYNNKDTITFIRIEHDLKSNFDIISMDFRGHGQSGGVYTFSSQEDEDLKAVIVYAKMYYKKIGVLGFSYGGSVAIIEDAKFHNINSIACVGCPMASDQIENRWWSSYSMKFGMENFELGKGARLGNPFLKKTSAIDAVSEIADTSTFFIHGSEDPIVDKRHSQTLYEKAKGVKQLKIFENAGHAEEVYRKYPREFIKEITEWFNSTL